MEGSSDAVAIAVLDDGKPVTARPLLNRPADVAGESSRLSRIHGVSCARLVASKSLDATGDTLATAALGTSVSEK